LSPNKVQTYSVEQGVYYSSAGRTPVKKAGKGACSHETPPFDPALEKIRLLACGHGFWTYNDKKWVMGVMAR
jgi:hypothetical protein